MARPAADRRRDGRGLLIVGILFILAAVAFLLYSWIEPGGALGFQADTATDLIEAITALIVAISGLVTAITGCKKLRRSRGRD